MRRFVRDNSLSLFFLAIFLGALFGQSVAGHRVYNADAVEHGSQTISYARYLVSSHFGQGVLENWQSEYLQFTLYIVLTIYLLQRGSNESKPFEDAGRESDADEGLGRHAGPRAPGWARFDGGFRRWLYSNSLVLVMLAIFFGSWFGQSVNGWRVFDNDAAEHHQAGISYWDYLRNADFWEATLQNWQSEFLAVGSMAVFTIYLRQRGSPESKPVGAPHEQTGAS
jgi:hypothetical protein